MTRDYGGNPRFLVDCSLVTSLSVFCEVSGLAALAGFFPGFLWGMESIFFPLWPRIGAFCMWLEGSVGYWHWCLRGALQGSDARGHVLTAAGLRVGQVCPDSVRDRNDLLHLRFR